jgi:uncharacterized membrane protein SpoIIM required for sporulation
LFAYLSVIVKPYTVRSFVGEAWVQSVEEGVLQHRVGPANGIGPEAAQVSSHIMTNNIQVAFDVFALGITFGVGTCYFLVTNGFLLGGLAGMFDHYGLSLPFWGLILPHGVIELPAICIAAAAGLVLAYALIRPGDYSRVDSLKLAAPEAVRMVVGTIPLFAVAAVIEAFFTPLQIDPIGKLVFALVVALSLIFYLFFILPSREWLCPFPSQKCTFSPYQKQSTHGFQPPPLFWS